MSGNFYVYILAYPDGKVFYVGKGTAFRIGEHESEARNGGTSKKCEIIREIWAQGKDILKKKLYQGLSEQDALAIEAILIDLFDRADIANKHVGHRKTLPRRSKRLPKIVGHTSRTWIENGLYNEESIPVYEEISDKFDEVFPG